MSAEEYGWSKTDILVAGKLMINVESFSFKRSADVEVFYGNDGEPSGWGVGEIKSEGELEVSGQEYSNILEFAIAQKYDLLKIPPLPIIIVEKSSDLPTIKYTLSQVKFKETGFNGKNKDKRYLHKLPFAIVGPVIISKG